VDKKMNTIKKHRRPIALLATVSLIIFTLLAWGIISHPVPEAKASQADRLLAAAAVGAPTGTPVLGTSTLVLSTATSSNAAVSNLSTAGSNSLASGGTSSGVGCYNMQLMIQTTAGGTLQCPGVFVGTTSSTCTIPLTSTLAASTSASGGTLANYSYVSLPWPATNPNQLWFKLNIGGATYGGSLNTTGTINAVYTAVSP
jgi:hypothetical protein